MNIIYKMAIYTFQYEVSRHVLNILADIDAPLAVKYPVSVLGDITLKDFSTIKSQINCSVDLKKEWDSLSDVIDEMILSANGKASKMLYDPQIRKFLLQE